MDKLSNSIDFHVHFGRFCDAYYKPSFVLESLAIHGIKEIWGSSTSACFVWDNKEEKQEILTLIKKEIVEATQTAEKFNIKFSPLYRVIPKEILEGSSIKEIMDNSLYKGFKIHPLDNGFENKEIANKIMKEVCDYASEFNLPILIHTGEDSDVLPNRFENFFQIYSNNFFILAHCKEADKIISLFQKYKNVYGDTAFCPEDSFTKICENGYRNRMFRGTDFPINHWFKHRRKSGVVSKKELIESYKETLDDPILRHTLI